MTKQKAQNVKWLQMQYAIVEIHSQGAYGIARSCTYDDARFIADSLKKQNPHSRFIIRVNGEDTEV